MTCTPAHKLSPERKILPILRALERRYGVPRRRLWDPLEVLVHGVLSQNTTDVNADRAYDKLTRSFGTWEAVAAAPQKAVERAIRESGLAAQKASTIKAVMRWLRKRGEYSLEFLRAGQAEQIESELTSIKGVGIKTARLVALFGFGRPLFVVDTHVLRVTMRLGLIPDGCTRHKAHLLLDRLVPNEKKYSGHLGMIWHGRRTCRARRPLCDACAVRRWCVFVSRPT